MANNEFLAGAPGINIGRSSWKQNPKTRTSFKHSEIVPIDCRAVLPGESLVLDLDSLIRMNTPIAPIDDDIECEINAFFVPLRLVWSHTEEFFGANKLQAGYPTTTYKLPAANLYSAGVPWNSNSKYLGKPVINQSSTPGQSVLGCICKERGYWLIWNYYYRAQMIQNPVIIDMGDTGAIGTVTAGGVTASVTTATTNAVVCKNFDYFVTALQSPQYGASTVQLPLEGFGSVQTYGSEVFVPSVSSPAQTVRFRDVFGAAAAKGNLMVESSQLGIEGNTTSAVFGQAVVPSNLIANMDNVGASINALRQAFATQHFLERANYGGNLYQGQLLAHYGVTPSDKSLQMPERLGTQNFLVNISQVTAMADTTIEGAVKPAGSTGAVSVTGNRGHLFTKAFEEYGYVYILLHTRIKKQTYSQGLDKEDTKRDRLEIYSPEFAALGDQPIFNKELFIQGGGASNDDRVFGYQSAWSEYHYFLDKVTGVCDPSAGAGVAVDIWTLTNKFNSLPQLNEAFVKEDRNVVASRLITGTSSNYDYLGFFNFHYTVVAPMPVHVVPGTLGAH